MQSPTILYIEDSPQNIRLIQKMLKSSNYNMVYEYHGKSGIKRALADKPDVILIDIRLPDISGIEVMQQLRQDEALKQVPMIALTADNSSQLERQSLDAGFNSHLTKPIDRLTLIQTIETYLATS